MGWLRHGKYGIGVPGGRPSVHWSQTFHQSWTNDPSMQSHLAREYHCLVFHFATRFHVGLDRRTQAVHRFIPQKYSFPTRSRNRVRRRFDQCLNRVHYKLCLHARLGCDQFDNQSCNLVQSERCADTVWKSFRSWIARQKHQLDSQLCHSYPIWRRNLLAESVETSDWPFKFSRPNLSIGAHCEKLDLPFGICWPS